MANIEEKVESLTSKIIQDLGYFLYDVEYIKEGKKQFKGLLKSFDKDYITISNDEEIKIDRKNISQIKTVYNW